jgi:NTP pyrophosphatase (non-canonical NTP hydrolase)
VSIHKTLLAFAAWRALNFDRIDPHVLLWRIGKELTELRDAADEEFFAEKPDVLAVQRELADVIFQCVAYAIERGWDVERVLAEKMAILQTRDYRKWPKRGRPDGVDGALVTQNDAPESERVKD